MIKKCNFKYIVERDSWLGLETKGQEQCCLSDLLHSKNCDGEDNCIIYQIYKNIIEINPNIKSRMR